MQSSMALAILVALSCFFTAISSEELKLEEFKPIPVTDVENNRGVSTNENGEELCEGDMVCDKKTKEGGSDRNAINGEQHRWPKKDGIVIVPYVFHFTLSDKARTQVLAAAADYAGWTCIKFVERTDQKDYLNIAKSLGCFSAIGRQGGIQLLSLGQGCDATKGTPTHEMMHALGFNHEQTRHDRDEHVTVRLDLVEDGRKNNFEICSFCTDPVGIPYDYRSVMHYGATAFSKNGDPTIIPKNGDTSQIGQRAGLCTGDIKRLNQMYKCGGVTASPTKPNNGAVPCGEKIDIWTNCFVEKCSDPDDDYKHRTMCPKTCQGTEKEVLYDRYLNCKEFANSGEDNCKNNVFVRKHCTLSCSKL